MSETEVKYSYINNITQTQFKNTLLEYFYKYIIANNQEKSGEADTTLSYLLLNINLELHKFSGLYTIIKIVVNDLESHIDETQHTGEKLTTGDKQQTGDKQPTGDIFIQHLLSALQSLIQNDSNTVSITKEELGKKGTYLNFIEFEYHLKKAIELILVKDQDVDKCTYSIIVLILSTFLSNYGLVLHDLIDVDLVNKLNIPELVEIVEHDVIVNILKYFANFDLSQYLSSKNPTSVAKKAKEIFVTVAGTVVTKSFSESIKGVLVSINNDLFKKTVFNKHIHSCINSQNKTCEDFLKELCTSGNECSGDDCSVCINGGVRDTLINHISELATGPLKEFGGYEFSLIQQAMKGSIICQIISKCEILIDNDCAFQIDSFFPELNEFKLIADTSTIEHLFKNIMHIGGRTLNITSNTKIIGAPNATSILSIAGFKSLFTPPTLADAAGSVGSMLLPSVFSLSDFLFETLYLTWGVNQYLMKYHINKSIANAKSNYFSYMSPHSSIKQFMRDNSGNFVEPERYTIISNTLDTFRKDLPTQPLILYIQLYYNMYVYTQGDNSNVNINSTLSYSSAPFFPLKMCYDGNSTCITNYLNYAMEKSDIGANIMYPSRIDIMYLFQRYAFNCPEFHKLNNNEYLNILHKSDKFTLVQIFKANSFVKQLLKFVLIESSAIKSKNVISSVTTAIIPPIIKGTFGAAFRKTGKALMALVEKVGTKASNPKEAAPEQYIHDYNMSNVDAKIFDKMVQDYKSKGKYEIILIKNDTKPKDDDILGIVNNFIDNNQYTNCIRINIEQDIEEGVQIIMRDKIVGGYGDNNESLMNEYFYTYGHEMRESFKSKIEEMERDEHFENFSKIRGGKNIKQHTRKRRKMKINGRKYKTTRTKR